MNTLEALKRGPKSKCALHWHAQDYFCEAETMSLDGWIDIACRSPWSCTPAMFRLYRNGAQLELPVECFDRDQFCQTDILRNLVKDRAVTLTINRVDKFSPKVELPIRRLELELLKYFPRRRLATPLFANCYVSPPHSQGFLAHSDASDNLVVQLTGTKLWTFYRIKSSSTLSHVRGNVYPEQDLTQGEQIVLKAGESLYVPKGLVHKVCATNDHSVHLTVSLCWKSRADQIEEVARNRIAAHLGAAVELLDQDAEQRLASAMEEFLLRHHDE